LLNIVLRAGEIECKRAVEISLLNHWFSSEPAD
jgi:hypothetical protein